MNERGQLIVEILLAIAVSFFFLVGAAALTAASLSASRNATIKLKAENLQKEAFEAIRIIRDTDWVTGFEDIDCTSACKTVIVSGAWALQTGSETISLDGISFTRTVKVTDVCREPDGDISGTDPDAPCSGTGEFNDPITKKATIEISWPQGSTTAQISSFAYLIRYNNAVKGQTDWVGGTGQCSDFTDTTKYCVNSGASINHATAGEVTLN